MAQYTSRVLEREGQDGEWNIKMKKQEYSMGYPEWKKVGRALRFGGSTGGRSTYRHVQKLVVRWKGRF